MKKKITLILISLVTLIIALKWINNTHTFALSSPTDTSLTFVTKTPNKIEANLLFYKQQPTFTLEAWIKPTGTPDGFYVITGSATGNNLSAGLVLKRNLKVAIHDYATAKTDVDIAFSTTTLSLNQWYHVAAVYKNGEWGLYVNGLLETTATYPLDAPTASYANYLVIGSPSWNDTNDLGSARVFSGNIADVRVWNVARTTEEIVSTKDSELSGNESGLMGYYKLDASTTGTVYDRSPHAMHATATNFVPSADLIRYGTDMKTQFTFRWNAVSNATLYTLTRNGSIIYSGTSNTFNDTGLPSNTGYTYTLKAESSNGISSTVAKTYRTPIFDVIADPVTLDGVDDYFEIPYSSVQQPKTTFTFETKVFMDPKQNGNKVAIIADTTRGSNTNQGWYVAFDDRSDSNNCSGGCSKALVFHAYDTSNPVGARIAFLQNAITEEGWYHIAVSLNTVSGNDQMKLYLNGNLIATQTNNGGLGSNDLPMYLGTGYPTYDWFVKGMILETRMWNTERTASELVTNVEKNLTGSETGLIGLWKFDGMTTGKTYDKTSQKNDAIGRKFKSVMLPAYRGSTDTTITYTFPTFAGMKTMVERDGVVVNNNAGGSFTDNGLSPDTTYMYTFYAANANGETDKASKTIRTIKPPTSGLSFDGVDDYLDIPANSGNSVSTAAITQEAWVKMKTFTPQAFINKEVQYEMQVSSTGSIQVAYFTVGNSWYWIDSGYKIPLNTWTHVASTFDGDRVRVYVNGVLVADLDYLRKGNLYPNTRPLRIGARDIDGNNITDNFVPIEVANVRIWNTVRSEQQIRDTMNEKLTGSISGLGAAYYMNPMTNGKAYDATNYANHGTMKGTNPLSQITPGSVTTTSIPLTWNGISDATTYELKKDGVIVQNTAVTSFTDTAAEDEKHIYTLTPKGIDGESQSYIVPIRTLHSKGLVFNGTTHYDEIDMKGYVYTGQPISLEARIKPEVTPLTNTGRTEEMVMAWRGWHQGILYDSTTQKICMQMYYVRKSDNVKQKESVCTPLAAGTEEFVSATFDPTTRTTKLYIDGVLKTTYTTTYGASTHDIQTYVGYLYTGTYAASTYTPSSYAFKGTVYEMRFWNKTLSDTEVQTNTYTDFTSGNANLLGYWRMYNFSTQSVYDQTGNNRTINVKNRNESVLNGKTTKRTNTILDLTWDKTDPSETFTVEKNGSAVMTNGTTASYTASGLAENTDYAFTIQAKNQYGQSTKEALNETTFATSPHINGVPADVVFPTVTLTGQQQSIKSNLTGTLDVSNFAGGTEWNVSVAASPITMKDGKHYALPKGSMMLSSPSGITATDGTTSVALNIQNGIYPIDDGSSYKVLSASAAADVGAFSATFPASALTLTLTPAVARTDDDNYPNTFTPYETTITWSINIGP